MQPKISVIVPVYKVEKYLHRCVDSILAQTFTDFEVLLIDDGSPDKSGEICDEYAKKDSRVRVFHKENGGVSSARNFGIERAVGEWIMFVDSDDYIELETLEVSVNAIENANFVDIVVFGIEENHYYSNQTIRPELNYIGKHSCIQKELEEADKNGWLQGPVCKLFKREIIIKQNLRFDIKMSYGEDTKFSFEYLILCKRAVVLPNYLYHYCFVNNESLTKLTLDLEYTIKLTYMLKEVRIAFAEHFKMLPSYYQFVGFVYASWMTNVLRKIVESNMSNKKELYVSYIKQIRGDKLMQTYKPQKNQSRNYSLYIRYPMLWYCLVIFIKWLNK